MSAPTHSYNHRGSTLSFDTNMSIDSLNDEQRHNLDAYDMPSRATGVAELTITEALDADD